MNPEIPVYDKEGWWKVCKDCKPELTRQEFEMRWAQFIAMTSFLGLWRQ